MAYLGRQPVIGAYLKLDTIRPAFNSAQTVFNLTSSSVPVIAGTSRNLIISIAGVIQEPDTAYTVAGSTITFASAPATAAAFFGVVLGSAVDVGVPSAGLTTQMHIINTTQTKTSTYVMTPADDLIFANGTFTVTLYTAVGNAGREIEIRNIATGTITVAGNAAELIDSTNTTVVTGGQTLRVKSDGTQWWKLGSNSNPPFADPNFISGNLTDW